MEDVSEWTPVFDPKYNRVYYYNKRTLVSTWNCPPDLAHKFPQYDLISSRNHNHNSTSTLTHQTPLEPEEDIWLECQDSRYNRPYYYNLRSRRSTWTLPTSGRSQIIRKPKRQLAYLPKGTAVRVKMVRSNPLLNGMLGTVVSDGSDRVKLLIAGKVLSFSPDNLEVVDKDEVEEARKKEKHYVRRDGNEKGGQRFDGEEEESDVASTDASSIASRLPVNEDDSDASQTEDEEEEEEEEGRRKVSVAAVDRGREEKEKEEEEAKVVKEQEEEQENPPFFSDRSRLAKLFGTVQRASTSGHFFLAGVDEEEATRMLTSATKGQGVEEPEPDKEKEPAQPKAKAKARPKEPVSKTETETETESAEKSAEEKKFAVLKKLNMNTEDIIQRIGALKGNAEFEHNEKFASLVETINLLQNPNPNQLNLGGGDQGQGEHSTDAKVVDDDAGSELEYPQSDESVTLSQS